MSERRRCPACGADGAAEIERVAVERVARGWTAQFASARATDASTVLAYVRADVGADTVRMFRCATCGVEHADPARTWRAEHYPVQDHGFGFDHDTAVERLGRGTGRLLEIGCADGAFLGRVAPLGYEAIGLDFAPESVAAAAAAGRDVRRASVDALADAVRRDAPFDVVAMFQIIEHLEAPDRMFDQLGAVSRPGTRLLIGCPAPRRFARLYANAERIGASEFWDYPPQHTLRWTAEGLRRFLGRHGWAVTVVRPEPFNLVGAAAHLVSSDGHAGGWYDRPLRRRVETAKRLATLVATGAPRRCTGVRLYVEAEFRGPSASR
ncbi:MAG: class I SAM-dependent methyltransferase [Gemmatimonadota bacterium]|nr:class I SAM-dependent methyltransferase [Gemmatimonadota bacterium]